MRRYWRVVLAISLLGSSSTAAAGQTDQIGVVIEELVVGSAPAWAGLRAGDVVLSWQRLPNPPANPEGKKGEISSVFDWAWFEVEQAPRGKIRLTIERSGQSMVFDGIEGQWDVKVRPRMATDVEASYVKGRQLLESEDPQGGVDWWQKISESAAGRSDWRTQCWINLRIGEVWSELRSWENAETAYRAAVDHAMDPKSKTSTLHTFGVYYYRQYELISSLEHSNLDNAMAMLAEEQRIWQANWGEGLGFARTLDGMGIVARLQTNLPQAEQYHQQALSIKEEHAPESFPVAYSLTRLGLVALTLDESDRSNYYSNRALAVHSAIAPESREMAYSLLMLGMAALKNSLLHEAHEYFGRVLEIRRSLVPGTISVAGALSNMGEIAMARGDLELAEDYYLQTLTDLHRLAPGTYLEGTVLVNLGDLNTARGDHESAKDLYLDALKIWDTSRPNSITYQDILTSLGNNALRRGDSDAAEVYAKRVLARVEEVTPDTLRVASALVTLGSIAFRRSDFVAADGYYMRALEIQERKVPESLHVAEGLFNLGLLAKRMGESENAEERLQHALRIRSKLAPRTTSEAAVLSELSDLYLRGQDPQKALVFANRAIDTLESQVSKLGGSSEARARFQAEHRKIYRQAGAINLALDLPAEAFGVLERSRARGFLEMLAERDLIFSLDLPEELETERRRVAADHNRALQQIEGLSPEEDAEKIETLLGSLRRFERERDEISAKIRRSSPRLAALHYPRALGLPEVQEMIDPGTLMLSFSVDQDQSILFAVTSEDFEAFALPTGEAKLRQDISHFRELIQQARPGSRVGSLRRRQLTDLAEGLFQSLVAPAAGLLATAQRIVIVPDGPLHLLPFGALIHQPTEGNAGVRDRRYLAEVKPLHSVLSATVYAELKRSRSRPNESRPLLAAFGDPYYPPKLVRGPEAVSDVRVRSAVTRGFFSWESLPFSRREVEQVTQLFPAEAARSYLGREATEERAKVAQARILHFAVHGYFDDRIPLNSALALTIPEELGENRDNGLLQAWEIFESVRLDADLVVLSACASGLGQELGGEGLIGLTRAFQYAGARTVAATLWNVDDQATAELMARFYRHLRAGKPKDEALQAAQIELIRGPIEVADEAGKKMEIDASAPYYWAAFQILGDWQ